MGTVSPNASTGADYTIASNVITVTDGRNHTAPYQYCVATNTLTVTPQSTKYGTAAGTIVLPEVVRKTWPLTGAQGPKVALRGELSARMAGIHR